MFLTPSMAFQSPKVVLCEIGALVKLYTSILGVLGKIATSLWVTIGVYGIVDPVLGSSLGQKAQVQHSLVAASPFKMLSAKRRVLML
jgi:hypothetical protein